MAEGPKPFYKRHSFWLVVCFAVSAACLWYAMKDLLLNAENRKKMVDAFRDADYRTLPLVWLILFVFYWIKAWRWAMLLSPLGKFSPLKDLFPAVMIGFAINNVTPAHLGDFARVYLFARERKLPATAVLSTVVLERVFDIIAILCFLCTGLLFVEGLDESLRRLALAFGAVSACGVLGAMVYVFWTPWFVRVAERILPAILSFTAFIACGILRGLKQVFRFSWFAAFADICVRLIPAMCERINGKIAGIMEGGAEGLASLKSWKSLLGIMFTSLAQWALNAVLFYIAIQSFRIELESPLLVTCIVMGVVAFGVTVPSTPGYFGVIQALFWAVLKLFTDDQANVFAASVYYHLSQYIPVTIVGLAFLFLKGMNLSKMQSLASEEKAKEKSEADTNAPVTAAASPM